MVNFPAGQMVERTDTMAEGYRRYLIQLAKSSNLIPLSWIWMIESGYNAQRDAYNKKHGITFSKQVITKTAKFTITEGPLSTTTADAPYHVDLRAYAV